MVGYNCSVALENLSFDEVKMVVLIFSLLATSIGLSLYGKSLTLKILFGFLGLAGAVACAAFLEETWPQTAVYSTSYVVLYVFFVVTGPKSKTRN